MAVGAALAEETGLPLAVSGGSPEEDPYSEAAVAVDLLGLDRDAVLLDTTARNSHENALAFARLLEPQGIRNVVVVTNGIHMSRMAASLRAAGFQVYGQRLGIHLDAPLTAIDFVPSNSGLGFMHHVTSGYAGIVYYLARGRFSIGEFLGNKPNDAGATPAS